MFGSEGIMANSFGVLAELDEAMDSRKESDSWRQTFGKNIMIWHAAIYNLQLHLHTFLCFLCQNSWVLDGCCSVKRALLPASGFRLVAWASTMSTCSCGRATKLDQAQQRLFVVSYHIKYIGLDPFTEYGNGPTLRRQKAPPKQAKKAKKIHSAFCRFYFPELRQRSWPPCSWVILGKPRFGGTAGLGFRKDAGVETFPFLNQKQHLDSLVWMLVASESLSWKLGM